MHASEVKIHPTGIEIINELCYNMYIYTQEIKGVGCL